MNKLTITQGFPGSGKSRWADHEIESSNGKIVGVNRDLLRMMTGRKWWPANEHLVTDIQREAVVSALGRGLDVIVDDTFLKVRHVDDMRELAARYNADFAVKSFLHVPLHTCIQRDAARERSVGKDVIVRMYYDYWKQFTPPANTEGYQSIMVDIDGTLAHSTIPYPAAYSRDYMGDTLDIQVMQLVRTYAHTGFSVILMSGRSERHREVTEKWLAAHRVDYHYLFMRPADDEKTDDAAIKKQLYLDHVQGKYCIWFVLDDRPRVCRMWQAECGLKVLNVGDGVEF